MATPIGSLVANLRLDSAAFIRDLGKSQRDIASNTAKMRKSMRQVETASRNVSKQFRQLRVGAAALGGALVLGKWIKAFTEVETSLQQIVGLVGLAQRDVDKFGKAILKLGPAVGKGPGELADALFFITSAGLKGTRAMEALTVSAKAATAGLGETKAVADAVTSAMNAYATSNLSAAKATDILVSTVREGKLEASELASSIGQVLAVAENAKVRFDEVGASVAALTRVGIKTTEAVSGLRGVLVALAKETQQGAEVLKEYSLSYADLRKSIREKGLLATLTDLRNVIGTNETALVKIFGRVEAVTAVLALTGANAEQVRGIFQRMADTTGALDKAFAAVADTAGFKFNAAMALLTSKSIELGSVVIPKLADAMAVVAENINLITAALASFIAFKAAAVFGGIAVAAARLAIALRAAAVAGAALTTVMKLNPIAIAIGLVTGAAILLATATKQSSAAAREHQEAIDAVKTALGNSNPQFKEAATSARELAEADITASEARLELLDALIASQRGALGGFGKPAAKPAQIAEIDALKKRIAETKKALQELATRSKKVASQIVKELKAVPVVIDKETKSLKKATEALKVQAHQQRLLIDALKISQEEYDRVATTIEFVNAAVKIGTKATIEQQNAWADAFREAQKFRKELSDLKKAQDDAARAAKDHAEEQKRLAEQQRELLLEPFRNAIQGIQQSFTNMFETIFSGGITSTQDFAAAMKRIFINLAAEIAALMIIKPILGNIVGGITGGAGGGGGGGGIGGNIVGSLISKILPNPFSGATSGITSGISAALLGSTLTSGAAATLGIGQAAVGATSAGLIGSGGSFLGLGAVGGPVALAALAAAGLFAGSSLFGGGSKTPRAGARVAIPDFGTGRATVGATGATGGGNIGLNVAEAQRAADALNAIIEATGGHFSKRGPGGNRLDIESTTRSVGGNLTRTADDIVRDVLQTGIIQGVSQSVIDDILRNGLDNFKQAAEAQEQAAEAAKQAAEAQERAAIAVQQTATRNVIGSATSISQFINQQRLQNVSPSQGLVEAQRQFGEGLARVRGGDLGATQTLLGSARDLLSIGRQNFASTTNFQAIDRFIQSSLLSVADQITSEQFINAQVEAIRQQTEVFDGGLEALRQEVVGLRQDIRRQTMQLEAA